MRTIGLSFAAGALLALPQLAEAQKIQIQINGQNVQNVQVQAQPIRFGNTLPGNLKLSLLQIKDVQEELKLTDDQIAKIDEFVKKQQAVAVPIKNNEDFQKRMKEIAEGADKIVADTLKAEQSKRLDQLDLQRHGINSPKAIEALKITDEQKAKFKDIQMESLKELRAIFQGAQGGNGEEAQKKIAEFQGKIKDKLIDVLTPEQKTTWKDMTGEPFKGKLSPVPFGAFNGKLPIKPIEKKDPNNIQ